VAGFEVDLKPVTVEPPVAPAVKATDADVLPLVVAVPIVGACGTVVAVMLLDAAEAALVPRELVAVTVNVYEVFDCRPVTVTGDEAPVPVNPPGLEVTVYPVIGKPPSKVGAVKVTSARPLL
jgi:hypothetical protein